VSELKNKTVVITGGARRLGKSTTLAMARAGGNVALTYLGSDDHAQQTLVEVEARGVKGLILQCDVRREDSVGRAVEQVLSRFGGIDVLVNNAGIFLSANLQDISLEQWDDVFATNVRGPFLVSKLCLPALRKSRGRIINMGSLGGIEPWAKHAHYCSSKAALHMLTRVMAKALAPEIAVNCVAPGMIDIIADPGRGKRDADFFTRMAAKTPMKKNGTAEDVAAAVVYFATASHFITGQILTVDGGLGL
jgi:NAD(P)-dependent dehydrogenase (short-subunit alcohol dehydrogenase family)